MLLKKKNEDGSYIQMKVSDDATWREATAVFVNFLQGCGYIVKGSEIGQYLAEEYKFEMDEHNALAEIAERMLEHEYKPKTKRRKKNARSLQKRKS